MGSGGVQKTRLRSASWFATRERPQPRNRFELGLLVSRPTKQWSRQSQGKEIATCRYRGFVPGFENLTREATSMTKNITLPFVLFTRAAACTRRFTRAYLREPAGTKDIVVL